MKAKLFVRGMKEPIELERLEAIAAQELIASSSDGKTPFSIEGVIATKKEDMKFVVFDKAVEDRKYAALVPEMEEEAALLFQQKVVGLQASAISLGLEEYHWPQVYMQETRAVRLEFFESPLNVKNKRMFTMYVRDPSLFEFCSTQIESFQKWKGRKEFAARKRDEQLMALDN